MRAPPPAFASGAASLAAPSSLPPAFHAGSPPFPVSLSSLMARLPPSLAPAQDTAAPSSLHFSSASQLHFPSTASLPSSSAASSLLPSAWSASVHQHGFPPLGPSSSSLASFPPSSSSFSSSSSPSLSLRSLDAATSLRLAYPSPAVPQSSASPSPYSRSSSPAPYEAPTLQSSTSPNPFAVEPLASAAGLQAALPSHLQSQWWLQLAAATAAQQQQTPSQAAFLHSQLSRAGGGPLGDKGGGLGSAPSMAPMAPFHPSQYSLSAYDAAASAEKAALAPPPFDYFHPPPR